MYKLVLYIMMSVFFMLLYASQMDEELAMHTLFQGKHAVNRAVHAAAQQVDPDKLTSGVYAIDPIPAKEIALRYLQKNLHLDDENDPVPGSFLRNKIEIPVFLVINEEQSFPYHYTNDEYDYEVTLNRPGVIIIIRMAYPRTYNVIGPIVWHIKGVAELVY